MKAWSPNHWTTREFPKCQILREQLYIYTFMSHMGLSCGSDGKGSACNAGCLGLIPVLRKFPGGGHGTHSSILAWKNLMDRGAWQTAVHGIAKRQT